MEVINTITELARNKSSLSLLEIGPGDNPITDLVNQEIKDILKYEAIDKEYQSTTLNIKKIDFLNFKSLNKFDIIIDRLCWHEQSAKTRLMYLKHTFQTLKIGGHFICEHAIHHNSMDFLENDLLYDEASFQLFKQQNEIINVVKFIPPAEYIEKELIDHQFILKKFICSPSKKIICNRHFPQTPIKTDPDHLFFMAQKSFGLKK